MSSVRGFASRAGLGLSQRDIDHADQAIILERLLEEVDRAQFHGLDSQRDIAVSGHDQHRERAAVRFQALQKFDAVDAGHADIGDHAPKVTLGSASRKCWADSNSVTSKSAASSRKLSESRIASSSSMT